MPEVDNIVTALQQALGELDAAESSIARAHAGAKTVEARTTEVGFLGMAAGMRDLAERIGRTREAQLRVVVDAVAATTAVSRVSAEMRPADVVVTLTPAVQQIEDAATNSGEVLRELGAAVAQASRSLKGGAPRKMLGLLDDIDGAMTRTIARLSEAKRHTEVVIAAARELGNFRVGVAA